MAQDNLQSQNEQEIQFKKRARRRLVGAVALVLLMIVLLPMLLEDKIAQTPKEDVVITIPSQDKQQEAQPEPEPLKQVEPVQASPAPISNAPVVEEKAAESSAPINQTTVIQAKPVELPAPVVPEVQSSKKEEPTSKPIQTVAKTEDKSKSESARISIQIGVFSDPENVKKMQAQLSDKGLKSQTELIDTAKGKKIRLRVGPFSTKKDAETALAKVKSFGLAGIVVNNQ
jgi:DedD protein